MKEDYTVEWDGMNLPGYETDQIPVDSERILFLARRLQDGRITVNLVSVADSRPLEDQEHSLWSRPDRPSGLWLDQEADHTVARCEEGRLPEVCRWIIETSQEQTSRTPNQALHATR